MSSVNRRNFLSGLGSLGVCSAINGCRGFGGGALRPRLAAQLYSIHKIFWKQPVSCLTGLRAAGYDGVEFAGYGGHSAKEIRSLLDDAGLCGMGTHVNGFVDLRSDGLRKTLDFCAEAGFETVTTPHAMCESEAAFRQFGRDMSHAAEVAAAYGIKVGIHTTYDHFKVRFNGVTAWDAIFADASPLLQQEVDTSNAFHVVGNELIPLLAKYRGRHHMIHLKENVPSATATLGERPTDGGPCVPWQRVFDTLAVEPVAWFVVEAEAKPDTLTPLVDSARFLREKGWLAHV